MMKNKSFIDIKAGDVLGLKDGTIVMASSKARNEEYIPYSNSADIYNMTTIPYSIPIFDLEMRLYPICVLPNMISTIYTDVPEQIKDMLKIGPIKYKGNERN